MVGANPNVADSADSTPLIWASDRGHTEIFKQLLLAGADPNFIDMFGDNSLQLAIADEHSEVIEILENYIASFQTLSIRSIRKYRIDVHKIPPLLFAS